MHEPLYRQALRHSWALAWKHKLLWIFGLFAAFLGQMGLMELLSKVGSATTNFGFFPYWLTLPKVAREASEISSFSLSVDAWFWFIWLLVVLLGLGLLLIFVSVVSQGALIKAAANSTKHKNLPDVGVAWQAGTRHFWRLFFINLFKKIIFVLLALLIGWATVSVILEASVLEVGIFLFLFILVMLVGMLVSFLAVYAAAYIVVEEYSFGKAISAAWQLFTNHWLVSFEVGLIVLVLNLVLAAVTVFGFLVFFFPTLLMWFIAALIGNASLWLIGVIVGLILFLLFILLLGSVFTVFVTSVWTYLFMKMHQAGIKSRILHLLGQ